jgi:acetyltransferase-like isoleucine patch superfamily enzyme
MINVFYKIFGLRKIILLFQKLLFLLFYGNYFNLSTKIFGLPIISFVRGSKIKIGKKLVLISTSYFSEPGINHEVIIRTLTKDAELIIGDNVGISGGGICCAKKVVIGNNVMFGANAFVTDTDFHPINPENRRFTKEGTGFSPVIIEDNVFLGMNVLVLKGVRIGKNSVIAAGSVVTSDIPENVIAGGIPAKVIKRINS